ncbi:hypothetical protein PQJ75_03670 [Rhodoplanes sp. TEM]|uniref:Uncharacterized protein n=1 Tax=Rhodoplanes tepidamans TaxID=200616 RepID=A0ABT5J933_RHOTP|nr:MULTISPECIES: hypothetical protein [Rhodoplanes]MDC7786150.1 hypothetical protein [Rhodoplanes tepidamans]MDC7982817.1 hypothetical protein [Rhodoplanes sp. TEM]MDQ0357185.1 hypothetical protein [Rhodoplanes tepidamans]
MMGSADTIDPVRSDSVRIGMTLSQFTIGCEFLTASGRWRCTDVGTRTIVAIRLDLDHDPTWYEGPPYAVPEHVFDEYDLEDCSPASPEAYYDDSGRERLVPLPRG